MKTTIYIFFIIKKVQVSKAIAQASFPDAKNVDVEPLESLTMYGLIISVCIEKEILKKMVHNQL